MPFGLIINADSDTHDINATVVVCTRLLNNLIEAQGCPIQHIIDINGTKWENLQLFQTQFSAHFHMLTKSDISITQ